MKQIAYLILYILLLSSCMIKQNSYIQDLDFIYHSIEENHPGVYNVLEPNFCNNLEKFYTEAKTKLSKSKGKYASQQAITEFAKSFNDAHLWVHWNNNRSQKKNINVTRKFSISQLSDDTTWITLPTFDLNADQEKDFNKILQNIPTFQRQKNIIFDLRGNLGGNSGYGNQIINSLFGKEYADQKRCLHNKNIYVDWRASHGNLRHISALRVRYADSWLKNVEHGLKESLKQGNKFYREYSSECGKPATQRINTSVLSAKIIVVIDSVNVSAALDFIDELKIMTTNLILVGQTTKADRLYMEVRKVDLPSGSGSFFFPIKVYCNRARLDNEPYFPNIKYQDIDNTSTLQHFILTKITENK